MRLAWWARARDLTGLLRSDAEMPAQFFSIEPDDTRAEPAGLSCAAGPIGPGGGEHESAGAFAKAFEPLGNPVIGRERLRKNGGRAAEHGKMRSECFVHLED